MNNRLCCDCPRNCGVDRGKNLGFCGVGEDIIISRAAPHFWEEPCISGTRGSGAIFFAGCNLKCVYCQNHEISRTQNGSAVSVEELRGIIHNLEDLDVHNINFVTPTHFARQICETLEEQPKIPVVYNCGGYEKLETLAMLRGKIQVYLPDFKYALNDVGHKYSAVNDYADAAKKAVFEMYEQVGDCVFDEQGIIQKGLIIRHLILPGHLKNTFAFLDFFAENFRDKGVYLSLMSQYTPTKNTENIVPLNREITEREYKIALQYMEECGITYGFVQELSSADEKFIPAFDGTGVKIKEV